MSQARVTQVAVEALTQTNAKAQVTQVALEVLTQTVPSALVTQVAVEALVQGGALKPFIFVAT